MKGITPIISTIVLLLITVALAGAAWVYIGGFMGTYTEKSFTIPTGGIYCDSAGKIHVRVVNTGTTTIQTTDWVKAEATNLTYAIKLVEVAVSTRANAELTNATTTGTSHGLGQSGAAYTVTVGTVAGMQRIPVVCP